MRVDNFFVEQKLPESGVVKISDPELAAQWRKVLRLNQGETVVLLDNTGFEFVSKIKTVARDFAEAEIVEKRKSENIPTREVFLFQSLIKKERFEWGLEKGTELGVSHFIPVISERSKDKNLKINTKRAKKIIKEASEQSHRGFLPKFHETMKLEEALHFGSGLPAATGLTARGLAQAGTAQAGKIIVFHPSGVPFKSYKLTAESFKLFIGPEGGWSDTELELFKKNGAEICSLGVPTLRAETAAIVAASFVLLSE